MCVCVYLKWVEEFIIDGKCCGCRTWMDQILCRPTSVYHMLWHSDWWSSSGRKEPQGKYYKRVNFPLHLLKFSTLMLLFILIRSYIFFSCAVHLPALPSRWTIEAIPFHHYMWSHNTDFGSASILSLPEAH